MMTLVKERKIKEMIGLFRCRECGGKLKYQFLEGAENLPEYERYIYVLIDEKSKESNNIASEETLFMECEHCKVQHLHVCKATVGHDRFDKTVRTIKNPYFTSVKYDEESFSGRICQDYKEYLKYHFNNEEN